MEDEEEDPEDDESLLDVDDLSQEDEEEPYTDDKDAKPMSKTQNGKLSICMYDYSTLYVFNCSLCHETLILA